MASPGDSKGQRRGSCSHIMAAFAGHDKCTRCRDKKFGQDPCIVGEPCVICHELSDSQKEMLSVPSYKTGKDKKPGVLVSPSKVKVLGSVGNEDSTAHHDTHASANPPIATSASAGTSFVSFKDFADMNDKWVEQFARFEALLSYSVPKMNASLSSAHPNVSDKNFIESCAQPTNPVSLSADHDKLKGSDEKVYK